MNKPKLTQKYGGWICTGIHPCSNGQLTRWAETAEDSYKEYQKLYNEVDGMMQRAKLYKIVASRSTDAEKSTYTNDFRTERAYPYYDIYENDNDTTDMHSYVWVACVAVLSFIVYLFVC